MPKKKRKQKQQPKKQGQNKFGVSLAQIVAAKIDFGSATDLSAPSPNPTPIPLVTTIEVTAPAPFTFIASTESRSAESESMAKSLSSSEEAASSHIQLGHECFVRWENGDEKSLRLSHRHYRTALVKDRSFAIAALREAIGKWKAEAIVLYSQFSAAASKDQKEQKDKKDLKDTSLLSKATNKFMHALECLKPCLNIYELPSAISDFSSVPSQDRAELSEIAFQIAVWLDILNNTSKAKRYYYETLYYYPEHPKADLCRSRIADIDRMISATAKGPAKCWRELPPQVLNAYSQFGNSVRVVTTESRSDKTFGFS